MAKATFDNSGFPSGSFSKANTQNQFDSLHQGDIAALRPRAQGTPDMTVAIAAATIESYFRQVYYNNAQCTYAGGNTATMTAPTTNPRIDLVYLNSGGTISITTGTEAASPSAPTYPDLATSVPICEIYHRVGETSIVNYEDSGSNPTEGYIYRDVRPWLTLGGVSDHGGLSGLTDDDHSQYALLAGRSGGQTLKGGTGASENLVIQSTSHATRGAVNVKDPLLLDDQSGAPSAAGRLQRDGANVKFHDGTASRTLAHDNTTVAGDVTGTIGATTVGKMQGVSVETGTPTNGDVLTYNSTNAKWQHEAAGKGSAVIQFGGTSGAGSTVYMGVGVINATEETVKVRMPFAGTLKNFYGNMAPSQSDSVALTLMKNGSAQSPTFTWTAGQTGQKSYTAGTVSVSAGDAIDIKIAPNATLSSACFTFTCELAG